MKSNNQKQVDAGDGTGLTVKVSRGKGSIISNGRARAASFAVISFLLLIAVSIAAPLLPNDGLSSSLANKNLAPSWQHWFGTDWLGRDMFIRTIKGLALSIKAGLIGAASSAMLAMIAGLAAAAGGRWLDRIISWLIDLFLSIPHLVLLILIAFACGGGMKGIVIGIMATHWPSLARLVRAEALSVLTADYVHISRKLGKSRLHIGWTQVAPHLWPHIVTGFILLFPHAILHEAAITFLGLGLSPHEPAIGIILSESMRYLSAGMWWLALFPGLSLLLIVRAFDRLGEAARIWISPRESQD